MGYYNNNRENEINEDKAADLLVNALRKIETEEDIDTLTKLIKIFKKSIPLTRRKYLTAYLLKEALKHYHSNSFNSNRNNRNNRNDSKNRKNETREYKQEKSQVKETVVAPAEEKPRHPRVEIDPDKATSIFISIGKNRRVYPKDLVGILIAIAGIERDRIGDIKVLANYSFIQLYTEDAQTAIDKLNGYDYRGRKLSVSYSRQKSEEDSAIPEGKIDSGYESDYSEEISEEAMAAEDAAAYAAAEKAAADKAPFGNI